VGSEMSRKAGGESERAGGLLAITITDTIARAKRARVGVQATVSPLVSPNTMTSPRLF
jgi:hypothetical protein